MVLAFLILLSFSSGPSYSMSARSDEDNFIDLEEEWGFLKSHLDTILLPEPSILDFLDAIDKNDIDTVYNLAPFVDMCTSVDGRPIIFYAQSPEMISTLLALGTPLDPEDTTGNSVLHHAIESFRPPDIVEQLLDKGISPNLCNKQRETPLALLNRKVPAISTDRELLSKSARYARCLLSRGATVDSTKTIDMFVRLGISLDAHHTPHGTLLHCAAASLQCDIVEHLLDNHADVNITDKNGMTPLQIAVKGLASLKRGSAPHSKTISCIKQLLFCGAIVDSVETIKTLASLNIPLDGGDRSGNTLLHRAAANFQFDIIEYLLNSSRSIVNIYNKCGQTSLRILALRTPFIDNHAQAINAKKCLQLLISHGAILREKQCLYHPNSDGPCLCGITQNIFESNKNFAQYLSKVYNNPWLAYPIRYKQESDSCSSDEDCKDEIPHQTDAIPEQPHKQPVCTQANKPHMAPIKKEPNDNIFSKTSFLRKLSASPQEQPSKKRRISV